ncbi:MAG: hypothetical protein AVDCRST_MAG01-01-596, partial [uncultured Rubrobacteraceae bacterium]
GRPRAAEAPRGSGQLRGGPGPVGRTRPDAHGLRGDVRRAGRGDPARGRAALKARRPAAHDQPRGRHPAGEGRRRVPLAPKRRGGRGARPGADRWVPGGPVRRPWEDLAGPRARHRGGRGPRRGSGGQGRAFASAV